MPDLDVKTRVLDGVAIAGEIKAEVARAAGDIAELRRMIEEAQRMYDEDIAACKTMGNIAKLQNKEWNTLKSFYLAAKAKRDALVAEKRKRDADEAHRNRAPVILIATQIVRQDLGFQSVQSGRKK